MAAAPGAIARLVPASIISKTWRRRATTPGRAPSRPTDTAWRLPQATAPSESAAEIGDRPSPGHVDMAPKLDLWAQINSCWY